MSEFMRLQDLSVHTISRLLAADHETLTAEQAAAVQEFIREVGGLENACAAVALLSELENVG